VRFFLVSRKAEAEFTFDIDLARSQSEENPVYYVQYAHARICSVLREWGGDIAALARADLEPLASAHEVALASGLSEFPEVLEHAAREFAPHLVTYYLHDVVAARLHTYYNSERFLVDDPKVRDARLALVAATRQVLANGLAVLGVSAPERM
jgi:arginyl-tRNA synthetase